MTKKYNHNLTPAIPQLHLDKHNTDSLSNENWKKIEDKGKIEYIANDKFAHIIIFDENIERNLFNYDQEEPIVNKPFLEHIASKFQFTPPERKLFDYCVYLAYTDREKDTAGHFVFDMKQMISDYGISNDTNNKLAIIKRLKKIEDKHISIKYKIRKETFNLKNISLIKIWAELTQNTTTTTGKPRTKYLKATISINPDLYQTIKKRSYYLIETRAFQLQPEIYTIYAYIMEIAKISTNKEIIAISYYKLLEYRNLLAELKTTKDRTLSKFNNHLELLLKQKFFKNISIKLKNKTYKLSVKWWDQIEPVNKNLNNHIVHFELTDEIKEQLELRTKKRLNTNKRRF